ncbi:MULTISPECIES: cold-shock protein [unclassified Bacillus (in: firmicutes)]|uniref:cold-shock protein n=1 Tax=unclassified Bacillus (in: firmicutes) TaxID=185979 RepID=UPI0008E307AB|nr:MULTISPECIES: cold-shock protein [unclassified Bacillus (in: firmicutes)]SFA91718.1 Cold-inducible protein YdjO [Bacillus sp. UNCCL13]SFQ85643.1 Cold-inducible protein YdjO [Bacillus sp. cl95]
MAFGRRNEEEIVTEDTKVWECVSETCNCWIRDNFKSSETPKCPICNSDMSLTSKELQVIVNHSKNFIK